MVENKHFLGRIPSSQAISTKNEDAKLDRSPSQITLGLALNLQFEERILDYRRYSHPYRCACPYQFARETTTAPMNQKTAKTNIERKRNERNATTLGTSSRLRRPAFFLGFDDSSFCTIPCILSH